ncbi:MAG: Dabb family protein [Actinobacteria bacterium]|nr:Dabb family protein [Actinomycetota bacterium]
MIRHVLLFRFRVDLAADEEAAIIAELRRLPSLYPAMRRFGLGENLSARDRTFSHVMTLEFDRREELEAYLGSARHESFVQTRFLPSVAERVIGTYEAE